MSFVWVALGSAIGGMLRFALSSWGQKVIGGLFPWWTLGVNIAGSFLIGYLATTMIPASARQFLVPGFCGGFTTFSAFSLETVILSKERNSLEALGYVLVSAIGCVGAAWLGTAAGRRG
jgi:CrcB protein